MKRFKKKKKKDDKDITVKVFRQWVLRYRELTEELSNTLAGDKFLSRRVMVLPLIDCGEDYFIKEFSRGLPVRNAEEKLKYYPGYVELKRKLMEHIKDETFKEIIEESLLKSGDIFWVNDEARLVFNDLEI